MDTVPTLAEVLKKSDAEILRVGLYAKIIVREWHRLTGEDPSACDCQLKNYLRLVRLKHSKDENIL